ncbi:IS3 family transposase [Teretinema zuelzerae]|uniref:IS3 family transposase n=1 Tax=Teretinema zuelzerae TaxID=156 RepID=UPI001E5602AC|nr:IS3 family transposase [Teretinema zuelzerae]
MKSQYPIRELCFVACVSRSGFYKFLKATDKESDGDHALVQCMRAIQTETSLTYGYRRMKIAIEAQLHYPVNHKRIARLQKANDLQAVIRRKRFNYPKSSFVIEGAKPNILNRNFIAEKPNQKWVTDITYLQSGSQRLYMSALLDLYNNELVAYRISSDFGIAFVLETIKDAFAHRLTENLLIHSDQGGHYMSLAYSNLLSEKRAIQSMSRRGNCWDNAVMENFFSHLKSELIHRIKPKTREELEEKIRKYVDFYNKERIQTKLKMAPVAYRSHFSQTA